MGGAWDLGPVSLVTDCRAVGRSLTSAVLCSLPWTRAVSLTGRGCADWEGMGYMGDEHSRYFLLLPNPPTSLRLAGEVTRLSCTFTGKVPGGEAVGGLLQARAAEILRSC